MFFPQKSQKGLRLDVVQNNFCDFCDFCDFCVNNDIQCDMNKDSKIYVAGHRGMVGSAIVRELQRQGYGNIITRTHKELDLTRQEAVEAFFRAEQPEYVFLAAAKVGGIVANQSALADFMYENMVLEMNVIHAAWQNGCKKLEFLGSSCIYPRMAPQPMKESCLLTGELEKTNEAYALAKISGLKYCEFLNRQYGTDYISVMPTNLYGPRRALRLPDEQLQRQRDGKRRNRQGAHHKSTDRARGKGRRLQGKDRMGHDTPEWNATQAARCLEGSRPRMDIQDGAGGRNPPELPGLPQQSDEGGKMKMSLTKRLPMRRGRDFGTQERSCGNTSVLFFCPFLAALHKYSYLCSAFGDT